MKSNADSSDPLESQQQDHSVETRVIELMISLFELDPSTVTRDARLYEDLDLDSIDAVDLVVELKKISQKKINPDDFKMVRSVGDVIDAAEKLLND